MDVQIYVLVRAARQKESQQFERLQANQLTFGGQQFEYGANALFDIECRHHGAGMFGHQWYQHLQDVMQILVFVHSRQIV